MGAASAKTIRKWFRYGFDVYNLKTGCIEKAIPIVPAPNNAHERRYEGSCIDVSLGKLFKSDLTDFAMFKFNPDTGEELRYIPKVHELSFNKEDQTYHIPYGSTLLFETFEEINVPLNYYCDLIQKASLIKPFVWLIVGQAQPNYQGKIHGLIHVEMPGGLTIGKEAKILSLRYVRFDSNSTDYYEGTAGRHVNNIVSTEGKMMVGPTRKYKEEK